jgi:hypothetical protein
MVTMMYKGWMHSVRWVRNVATAHGILASLIKSHWWKEVGTTVTLKYTGFLFYDILCKYRISSQAKEKQKKLATVDMLDAAQYLELVLERGQVSEQ